MHSGADATVVISLDDLSSYLTISMMLVLILQLAGVHYWMLIGK